MGAGVQGGCEPGIKFIMKMQKSRGSGRGEHGGCEPRIEVIVKMQKRRGRSVGVRMDVNQELKLFV